MESPKTSRSVGADIPLSELLTWVREHPMRDGRIVPVMLWGDKGVGKSKMVEAFCNENSLRLRTYHPAHDNTGGDARGRPIVDEETKRTHYAIPAFLPSTSDAASMAGSGILFIDELNRASRAVQDGLFELIGDSQISQSGYRLPPGWQIVCAGNPEVGEEEDAEEYDVRRLDPALKDRMLHVMVSATADRWAVWARGVALEEDVVQFALSHPEMIAGGRPKLPESVNPQATPRSLEMLAALYTPDMPQDLLDLVASGLIGETWGHEFVRMKRDALRPLTGHQVVKGGWQRYVARLLERQDLLEASFKDTVKFLSKREVDWDEVASLKGFIDHLPENRQKEIVVALGRRAPKWRQALVDLNQRRKFG